MKPLKQNQTDNHQNEGNKREDKKKTDIKFNSAIFFQLGLVLALVLSAWAMNLKVGERVNVIDNDDRVTIDERVFNNFTIEEPKIEPPKRDIAIVTPPVQRLITDVVEVIKDDTPIKITKLATHITAPVVPDTPIIKPPVADPPTTEGPKNMISVEFLPIFPGCESSGDKAALKACMSEKIGRFVGRKFNTNVADNNTSGTQKIYVQFKIDKNGNVVDIIARAPDKNLEKEAQRVISKLPEFTPGKMGDVPVDVIYTLPITFKIN